jgi:Zn-dependent M28 family amino/carboxypeptidase
MAALHLLPALGFAACLLIAAAPLSSEPISAERIKEHVRILSSDAFLGRGPAQPGEAKAIDYIAEQFEAAGLRPAGPNGSWYQDVPLVRYDRGPVTIGATVKGRAMPLQAGRDVTAASRIIGRTSLVDAPIMFGGYGVVAPGLGFDPYGGADLSGKVVLVLAGDPDFEAGRDVGFGGRALAFAGRTGEKIAAAQAKGALAVLTIHEEASASYPWSQVRNGDPVPGFALDEGQPLKSGFGLRGWIRREVAMELLRRAGLDYARLKKQAQSPGFRALAVPDATLSAQFDTSAVRVTSRNVVGMVPGTSRAKETILYGAHWDAYGINAFDPPKDRIRNGAVDNATGTATLIEVARAFAQGSGPQRTILFAAWTAEEKGLLGAAWYASHPLRPLETTAAVFNLDPHVALSAARNLELIGVGRTPLEQDLARVASARGLRVDPEENSEAGWYYRSDHFAFTQKGVPTVYFRAGRDLLRGGRRAGDRIVQRYNSRCYHQTCDEFDPRWDMAGPAQEGAVAYDLGRELANSGRWPGWNPGSDPARLREASSGERR